MALVQKILAIDPGDRNLGWAREDGTCGYIQSAKELSSWDRINFMSKEIDRLLHQFQRTDMVIIEDGYRRGALMKLVGVLVGQCRRRCDVLIPRPSEWPKSLWGKEKAGHYKECAKKLAKAMGYNFKTQHDADAPCMIEWYRKFYEKEKSPKEKNVV